MGNLAVFDGINTHLAHLHTLAALRRDVHRKVQNKRIVFATNKRTSCRGVVHGIVVEPPGVFCLDRLDALDLCGISSEP